MIAMLCGHRLHNLDCAWEPQRYASCPLCLSEYDQLRRGHQFRRRWLSDRAVQSLFQRRERRRMRRQYEQEERRYAALAELIAQDRSILTLTSRKDPMPTSKPRCGALYTSDSIVCQLDPGHYDPNYPGVSPHVAHSPHGNGHTIEFVPAEGHTDAEPRWVATWDSEDRRLPRGAIAAPPMSLQFTGYPRFEGDAYQTYQIADERPGAGAYGQIDAGVVTFRGMSDVERAALRALCHKALRILDDTTALESREREDALLGARAAAR